MILCPGARLRLLKETPGFNIGREHFLIPVTVKAGTIVKVREYDEITDYGVAVTNYGAEIDLSNRLAYELISER